jgi:hypothetical protein
MSDRFGEQRSLVHAVSFFHLLVNTHSPFVQKSAPILTEKQAECLWIVMSGNSLIFQPHAA